MEVMVNRAGAASPAPSLTGLTLHKMSVHDDPQTFLEMFEATAAACGWPGKGSGDANCDARPACPPEDSTGK